MPTLFMHAFCHTCVENLLKGPVNMFCFKLLQSLAQYYPTIKLYYCLRIIERILFMGTFHYENSVGLSPR